MLDDMFGAFEMMAYAAPHLCDPGWGGPLGSMHRAAARSVLRNKRTTGC